MMTWPDDYINKVICGDCLEVMKCIPDRAVDLVVTDPPYMPPVQHYASRDERWKRCWGDYSPMLIFFNCWLQEIRRITKVWTNTYVFCNDQSYPVLFVAAIGRWDYVRCLKWDKGDAHFTLGTGFVFRPRSEIIAHCHNVKPTMSKGNRGDVLRSPVVKNKERSHPAEKPLNLVKTLIEASGEGKIILDPFLGSGTTAVAAKQLGWQYIGIEINFDYCEIAKQRLTQTEGLA